MADPSNQVFHYNEPVGCTFLNPVLARLQCTFSGGVATKDSVRRRSDPTIAIVKSATGLYAVTGLPMGVDGHVMGLFLDPGNDAPDTTKGEECQPRSFVPNAGTITLVFSRPDTGVVTDPPDGSRLYLTILVETGAYV